MGKDQVGNLVQTGEKLLVDALNSHVKRVAYTHTHTSKHAKQNEAFYFLVPVVILETQ